MCLEEEEEDNDQCWTRGVIESDVTSGGEWAGILRYGFSMRRNGKTHVDIGDVVRFVPGGSFGELSQDWEVHPASSADQMRPQSQSARRDRGGPAVCQGTGTIDKNVQSFHLKIVFRKFLHQEKPSAPP